MGIYTSTAMREYVDEYTRTASNDSRLKEQLKKEQTEKNTENKLESKVDTLKTPAVEVIFSTGMLKKVRGLSNSAQRVNSSENVSGTMSSSKIVSQCAALSAKLSRNDLSKGERTYIQSEIDLLERNVTRLNLAM